MKKLTYLSILVVVLFTACKNESPEQLKSDEIKEIIKTQPPGTLLDADSMHYDEDDLNNFYFTVKLRTTKYSHRGTYAVETNLGPNIANTQFTMPRGAEEAIPIVHKSSEPYTYIIGFYYNSDTTFYDYYKVSLYMGTIQMAYSKAYSIR